MDIVPQPFEHEDVSESVEAAASTDGAGPERKPARRTFQRSLEDAMREEVAVRHSALEEATGFDGVGAILVRPSGRRFVLLAALALTSLLALGTSAAHAVTLPDGRAYEQVTPANKDNGDPYLRAGVFGGYMAAATGNGFTYPSLYAFPGSRSDGIPYLSTRGSGGWSTTNEIPPQSDETGGLCSAYPSTVGWTPDMSTGILVDGANQASGCGTDDPLLAPGTTSGGLPLCSATPLVTPCSGEQPGVQNIFVQNNTDGTYQLVSNLETAPAGTTPSDAHFQGGSTDLSHVVFDEGAQLTSDAPSASDNLYEWSGGTVSLVTEVPSSGTSCTGGSCEPVVGSLAGGGMGSAEHAVSDDGSTVFFNAAGNLYARQNGTSTVQVDGGIGGGGNFFAASSDGTKVFFADGAGANLYEYDLSASSSPLTNLTPGGSAGVLGFSGSSDDGSHLYFVATSVLASNANGDGQTAQATQPNLYLVNTAAAGNPITYIATLNSGDSCDWTSGCLTARVSSNGDWVAFNSTSSLTGYNNNGASEIFLSDASADGPDCASCIPDGTPPTFGAGIAAPEETGINSITNYPQRYVSDSGQVFFNTQDALLPTASNGVQNVYEYEGGHVSLLSSGTNQVDSFYLDSTPSGNDAFFATAEALVPQDIDGSYDIYDARVGGGFPVPTPTPPCQGESCKPPLSTPPTVPAAGSVTFTGPGNAKPRKAKVRLVRRTIRGAAIGLRVTVAQRGEIRISGAAIRTVSRSVSHGGTYTVTVHLTGNAKSRLKRKRKLRLTLSVRYAPSAGGASTVNVNLSAKA